MWAFNILAICVIYNTNRETNKNFLLPDDYSICSLFLWITIPIEYIRILRIAEYPHNFEFDQTTSKINITSYTNCGNSKQKSRVRLGVEQPHDITKSKKNIGKYRKFKNKLEGNKKPFENVIFTFSK